jgi:hypothetical protein
LNASLAVEGLTRQALMFKLVDAAAGNVRKIGETYVEGILSVQPILDLV